MLFKQSSGIRFIYLFSKIQKVKLKNFIRQTLKQLIFTVLHKFQIQFMFMSTVIYKLKIFVK